MSYRHAWRELTASRAGVLRLLAAPVLDGIRRADTAHPAFHGCVDWHSAVHATYALLAAGRLCQDPALVEAALAAVGGVRQVRDEEQALRDGRLAHEIPYGAAWMLILDREAASQGITLFHGLAELARDLLFAHLGDDPGPGSSAAAAMADPAYANSIWPAVALSRWGEVFDDARALAAARRVAALALQPSWPCTRINTAADLGFLSPEHLALLLAADLGNVNPGSVAAPLGIIRETRLLTAAAMPTIHSAGLNFSRSWGVYAGWRLTGDEAFRIRCAELVLGHLAMPGRWLADYRRYAHWVPQFGVFAIAQTLEYP